MAEESPGTGAVFREQGMSGRTAHSSRLWLDNSGKRLPIVYTYDSSFGDDFMFEKVIKFWADNTCLTFKREQQSRCSSKQSTPAISLYSYGYFTEHFGIDKSKSCTKMSLGAGNRDSVHKLVMNVLGMLSYTYRKDSAKHMSMNEENLKAFLSVSHKKLRAVLASYHRCHGKTQVLPTPFDFLSKQMPSSSELGSLVETRPVYVTRNPRHQYLLDYHAATSLEPTFYDVMVINMLYKCPAEWAATCGGAVPGCKNHGFLMKSCRCRCPPGFSGDMCQTKSGLMFPLQPAAFQVTVSTDRTYDFGSFNLKTVDITDADRNFRFYIFIVIHIAPERSTYLPSVSLVLPFKDVSEKLGRLTTKLMRYLGNADCLAGLRLLWGSGSRLACDCLSSLVNNEPPSEARVFRGRRPSMGMTLINNLGRTFKREAGLTELTSQFRLTAEFRPPADFSFAASPGSKPVPVDTGSGGSGSSSDADSLIGATSTAAALTSSLGGGTGAGFLAALGPLSLLLMLLCFLLLFCRRGRRHGKTKKRRQEEYHVTEEADSNSETEDSED